MGWRAERERNGPGGDRFLGDITDIQREVLWPDAENISLAGADWGGGVVGEGLETRHPKPKRGNHEAHGWARMKRLGLETAMGRELTRIFNGLGGTPAGRGKQASSL